MRRASEEADVKPGPPPSGQTSKSVQPDFAMSAVAPGVAATGHGGGAEPAGVEPVQKKPALARSAATSSTKVIFSESITGALLDAKGVRRRVRQELKARNIIAGIADVKPIRHDRFYKIRGPCLRCRGPAEPVLYTGIYFRKNVGFPAKTLHITGVGDHDHGEDSAADVAAVFLPKQEAKAKEYLRRGLCRILTEWPLEFLSQRQVLLANE